MQDVRLAVYLVNLIFGRTVATVFNSSMEIVIELNRNLEGRLPVV